VLLPVAVPFPPLPVVDGIPPAPVVDAALVEDAPPPPPPEFPEGVSDPQLPTAIAIAAPEETRTKDANLMTVTSSRQCLPHRRRAGEAIAMPPTSQA
jgi:hypothetical protein